MDAQWWVLVALAVAVAVLLLVGLCSCLSQRIGEVERATAQCDGFMSGVGQGVPPAPACTPAYLPAAQSHNIYIITPMPASPAAAPAPYVTYASFPPTYPVLSEHPSATPSYPPSAPSASAITTQLPRESDPAELDPEAQPQPYQQLQQQLSHMTNNTHHEAGSFECPSPSWSPTSPPTWVPPTTFECSEIRIKRRKVLSSLHYDAPRVYPDTESERDRLLAARRQMRGATLDIAAHAHHEQRHRQHGGTQHATALVQPPTERSMHTNNYQYLNIHL